MQSQYQWALREMSPEPVAMAIRGGTDDMRRAALSPKPKGRGRSFRIQHRFGRWKQVDRKAVDGMLMFRSHYRECEGYVVSECHNIWSLSVQRLR